jgi:hypothetical protein
VAKENDEVRMEKKRRRRKRLMVGDVNGFLAIRL